MKLKPHELTFLAEELGRRSPAPIRWLTLLSRHRNAIVREGAVYGLARCVANQKARDVLLEVARHDENALVREAALEALE